ncbi:MFS transporter [Roseomonas terrae]|jgi:MFS family permease|uniref:MFS transporter n=1 Tax=Neoroseomonas terrae TaxID=424799 RepID=A0ABS5EI64_9PROT|nr:MFS transporter [Neoroseomonas terrae]MBR0650722.1 MFS transporter [Neoroseomonas terrae]
MLASAAAARFARLGIHYGWVMVALTFLVSVCTSAAVSLPGVLLVPMTEEFGWGRAAVSGAMGVMFCLFALMAPFAGALMIRYGLRRVVSTATVIAVTAVIGLTQVATPWQVWTCLAALGGAAGMVALVLSATVANRWFAERRGLVMGMLTAAFAAGQLTFLPAAAALAANHGWRMAILPAIIGLAICAVLYLLFARDFPAQIGLAPYGAKAIAPPPAASAQNVVTLSLSVLGESLRNRVFWILAGTFFICGLSSTGIVNQHFIPFCGDMGVSAVTAASFLAMMGIFNFIGTVCSGWLSDRFDNRALLAWYYGLRGLSLIWLPFSSFDMYSLTLFAIFFGLDYVATVPPTVKLAGLHFGPEKAAIVFGWAFAAHQLGSAVSAAMGGVWRDAAGSYGPAFITVGMISVSAALAVLTLHDARTRAVKAA